MNLSDGLGNLFEQQLPSIATFQPACPTGAVQLHDDLSDPSNLEHVTAIGDIATMDLRHCIVSQHLIDNRVGV